MKRKKLAYTILLIIGGVLLGYFVNNLGTLYGSFLFTLGIFLLVVSSIKINE